MTETRTESFPSRNLAIALAAFWIMIGTAVVVLTAPTARSGMTAPVAVSAAEGGR